MTHPFPKGFSVADLFGLEIMGGISRGLAEYHYDLLVAHVDPRDTEWATHYLHTGRGDGFNLMTSARKRRHVDHLLSMGAPFIAWGHGNGRYCSVVGDDRRGGRLATELSLSTGRSRVAFIGGPRVELEVLRAKGVPRVRVTLVGAPGAARAATRYARCLVPIEPGQTACRAMQPGRAPEEICCYTGGSGAA